MGYATQRCRENKETSKKSVHHGYQKAVFYAILTDDLAELAKEAKASV